MATINTRTIKTSGGDYTSLSNWEAGRQGDLVRANTIEVAECYSMADSTRCVVAGWTTGPNNYVRITVPRAERHNGTRGNGYRLTPNAGWSDAFSVTCDYIRIEGIAVHNANATMGRGVTLTGVKGSSDMRMTDCLLYDNSEAGVLVTCSPKTGPAESIESPLEERGSDEAQAVQ